MALILPAYAKLNLTLDVVARRPNGYHEIDSVMQTISLHDLLYIDRTDCRVFDVIGPAIEGENLVLKAARELEGRMSRQLPFTIRLFKRIPMGAGLGGGSSDAASFLRAANQLYNLRLTIDELAEIGTEVGHDVPFFLRGGTARATGLGSTLSPLPPAPSDWIYLVVCPPIQVPTRTVYMAVDGGYQSGRRTSALVAMLAQGSPHRALSQRGRDNAAFGNDLEPVTQSLFPGYAAAVGGLQVIIPGLSMSGSGAALFSVFQNAGEASAALLDVQSAGYPAWVTHSVPAIA